MKKLLILCMMLCAVSASALALTGCGLIKEQEELSPGITVVTSVTPLPAPSVSASVAPTVTPTVAPTVAPTPSEEEKLSSIIFEDKTFTYNGTGNSIFIKNLPAGYNVRYVNNSLKNVGERQAKALIYKGNTLVKTMYATITVTLGTFEGITFPAISVPFDGKEHATYLQGLSAYPNVKVEYTLNRLTEVGKVTATAVLSDSNYYTATYTTTVEITPWTFTGISLTGITAKYNGAEHSAVVSGLENYPNATVQLTDAARTNAGTQTAVLTVQQRGYTDLTLTAQVTVERAVLGWVTFPDTVFVYSGKEQRLTANGLPADVTPIYENNAVTEIGETKTATLTVNDPNYEPLTLTANVSVKKPEATVQGLDVIKRMFVNDPTFRAQVTYSDRSESEWITVGGTSQILEGTLAFENVDVTVGGLYNLTPYGLTSDYYDVIFENGTANVMALETNLVAGGAKAGENGTMLYNGKEVHTMGVDFFSLFFNSFSDRRPFYEMESGLAVLKDAGVRVIRINGGLFYADEATKYYFGNEENYWALFDRVVHEAAQNDIMIIPSFFWSFWVDDYYGETYDQIFADPATNTSQGFRFMMEYTRQMVTRYQHHPAIFAWEFGNEWNLNNDLPNWKEWMTCKQTVEKHTKILEYWANLIDEIDEYDRIITTGDSEMRSSQYHQYYTGAWGDDNYAQNIAILKMHNPGKISAVSAHVYGGYLDATKKDPTVLLTNKNYLTDLPAKTWKERFSYLVGAAKELSSSMNKNVTVYVGECGGGHGDEFQPGDTKESRIQKQKSVVLAIGDAMIESGMPVALLWNYDPAVSILFEGSWEEAEYLKKNPDFTKAKNMQDYVNQRSNGIEWSWNEKFGKGEAYFDAIIEINQKLEQKYGKF